MKALFRVFGPGRVNHGTYGNKHQALKAMRFLNSKRKEGERPFWVGPAEDHWRFGTRDEVVPVRGPEPWWNIIPGEDPELVWVPTKIYWLAA